MTLYTQVSKNRSKTWFYLFLYTALLLALGCAVAVYYHSSLILIIVAVWCICQGIAGCFFSDTISLAAASATTLDMVQHARVYKIVENLRITAGLPMPRLCVIDDTAINSFATGNDPQHAAIAITSGAIERLDDNELAGVLAHELSHIGNEDIRLMGLVMVVGGLIALISDIFLRSLWYGGGRRSNSDSSGSDGSGIIMIVAIALAILAPLAAALIQLAISRAREFMADANGVLLTRYPEGLISALNKIGDDDEPLEVANRATAHMYFSNPLKNQTMAALFDTHPPIAQRIEAIQRGSGMTQ